MLVVLVLLVLVLVLLVLLVLVAVVVVLLVLVLVLVLVFVLRLLLMVVLVLVWYTAGHILGKPAAKRLILRESRKRFRPMCSKLRPSLEKHAAMQFYCGATAVAV